MQTLYLLYHEIRSKTSDYTYAIDLPEFESQAAFLAARLQAERSAPERQAESTSEIVQPAITFDDGHWSNFEYALPVLERLGLSAHFFITAGWTGERSGYMGLRELRALESAGQQLGAHGWSHMLLTHCNRHELQRELSDSKRKLEDGLGTAVTSMSLPGGRFDKRVLAACREAGYERVFSSEPRAERAARAGTLTGRVNLLASSDVALLKALLDPRSKTLAALGKRYRMKRRLNRLLGDTLYARVWALANGGQDTDRPADAEA